MKLVVVKKAPAKKKAPVKKKAVVKKVTVSPAAKKVRKPRAKKVRSAAQIAADKARMAKVRAAKKNKKK